MGTLLLLAAACTGTDEDGDSNEGGGGASSNPTTGAGTPQEGPQGLFACELPRDCESSQHAGQLAGGQCVAELALSGGKGVALHTDSVGPYVMVTELLVLYLGDGTALSQARHYECQTIECSGEPFAWPTATTINRCDVVVDAAVTAACEMDTQGCWAHAGATLQNCVPEAIPSCEMAVGLLAD